MYSPKRWQWCCAIPPRQNDKCMNEICRCWHKDGCSLDAGVNTRQIQCIKTLRDTRHNSESRRMKRHLSIVSSNNYNTLPRRFCNSSNRRSTGDFSYATIHCHVACHSECVLIAREQSTRNQEHRTSRCSLTSSTEWWRQKVNKQSNVRMSQVRPICCSQNMTFRSD